jgi:hypothetical protein
MEMIAIGSTCEELWQRFSKRKAWAEYRNQPHVKNIRQEQALLMPFRRSSPTIRETIREFVSEEIGEILDDARHDAGVPTPKFKRLVSIPLRRPKGKRDWVKRVVARWARRAHRIAVSPRRVEDCWKEYRKFVRASGQGEAEAGEGGSRHDAGVTKPAFAPDAIERLRKTIKLVRERLPLGAAMERFADLVREDSQKFDDLSVLRLAAIYEEHTGELPGRPNQLIDIDADFYKFCRLACDAVGIDDMAFRGAINEFGRGTWVIFPALRTELFRGLPMAAADYDQVRIHFSMALDAVAEGKLPSDVLSPGPPVQITVESALIDAAVHLHEQEDVRVAESALTGLGSRRIKTDRLR